VEFESRQAALCVIVRKDKFLVTELIDVQSALTLHRPPGGGVEAGETPENAVRRELQEELRVSLTTLRSLGAVDHVWFWKGRKVSERAWLFLANASDDSRLQRGESPTVVEANGERLPTIWRPIDAPAAAFPPLCPSALVEMLKRLAREGLGF